MPGPEDNPMGTTPEEAASTEPGPPSPTEETPPAGEAADAQAESSRGARLRRAADYAGRAARKGASRVASTVRREAEKSPPPAEAESDDGESPDEPFEIEDDTEDEEPEAAEIPEPEAETPEPASADPVNEYLDRAVTDKELRNEIKNVLTSDNYELLKKYLESLGVEDANLDRVARLVKASPVRLIMNGLRDLGLPESKADEAHRIVVSERGKVEIDHIVGLGFGATEAEAVHELLTSSHMKILRGRMEKKGLSEETIDEILSVGDDTDKLTAALIFKLEVQPHIAERILKLRANQKIEEIRKQELGYANEDKIRLAHSLGISEKALESAEKSRLPVDLLIAAVDERDSGLRNWLTTRGVELNGTESQAEESEAAVVLNRKQRRQNVRELSKVPSLYPYPPGHLLYGLGFSNYPHMITKSETEYYRERMQDNPGQLRNSLTRPGSLPLPGALYRNRLTRPILDLANIVWCPLGKRLLAGRLYKFERSHDPDEDYGMLQLGLEKRAEQREHVNLVDKTIIEDRSLLSWHRRHRNRGDIRRNPRLDLAQSIAEARRDTLAFSMGRPALPSEEEVAFSRLQALPERNETQEELFEKLRKDHPEWE